MPALPYTSSEGYGVPQQAPAPRPMALNTLTGPADALTAGMADVTRSFSELWAHQQAAEAATQAITVDAGTAMKIADLQTKYFKDPDPATAPARFKAEAMDLQQQTLDGLAPGVSTHVQRMLARRIPSAYAEVSRNAFQQTLKNQGSAASDAIGLQAQSLAVARNPAENDTAITAIKSSIAGGLAAGYFDPGSASKIYSDAIGKAVLIKGVTDPIGAKALLDAHAGEMQIGDVASLQGHLRGAIDTRTVATIGTTAIQPGPMPEITTARATAVHDGFVARGFSDHAAWGLAANAVQESGANPAPPLGDGGRSSGLFQWNGDRRAAFVSQYGMDPHAAPLDKQLDFAAAEMNGSESRAGAAIRAATNPADAARIVSTQYLRPKDTVNEEPRRAGIANALTGSPPPRLSLGDALKNADTMSASLPPELRLQAASRTMEAWHQQDAGYAIERANLTRTAADLSAAYGQGLTSQDIPTDRIRSAFAGEPEHAQRMITDLTIRRSAGQLFLGVAGASPEEEQAARALLAVPGSLAAGALKRDAQGKLMPPALPGATATESADDLHTRQAVATQYDQMLAAKHEAIAKDPAAYAAARPELKPALDAVQANQPGAFEAYATAAAAVQRKLGVPEQSIRLMTNDTIGKLAAQLGSTDPNKTDMGAELDKLSKTYGTAWPQVMGELVQHGKISPAWQLMAAMSDPTQLYGRQDLQRALVMTQQKGGIEKLREDTPPDAVKTIRSSLDGTISSFREVSRWTPQQMQLLNTVRHGVETLALYRATQGMSGETALQNAYSDIIGKRWDVAGSDGSGVFYGSKTMLVPKGMAGDTERATAAFLRDLKPADLAPLESSQPLTAPQRADATLAVAQQGIWITNKDASGVVLMGRTRNGDLQLMRNAAGAPIGMTFDEIRARDYGPPIAPPRPLRTLDGTR